MTIIATKDGIMAADSLAFVGSQRVKILHPKLTQRRDGSIIGIAGLNSNCIKVRDWFLAGESADHLPRITDPDDVNSLDLLILRPSGRLFRAQALMELYEIAEDVMTIGVESAGLLATGAMLAGYCARKAVALAIEHSVWVAGEVYSLSL